MVRCLFFVAFVIVLTNLVQADPYSGNLLRGNTHVHTNLVNDESLRLTHRSYLKHLLKTVKAIDLDHLYAEELEQTVYRAYRIGLDFILVPDHDSKITEGYWVRAGELARKYTNFEFNYWHYRPRFNLVRGIEWTQGGLIKLKPVPHKDRESEINHISIFLTDQFPAFRVRPEVAAAGIGTETPNLRALYQWLLTKYPGQVICSFNHPSYGSSQFNNFEIPAGMERLVDYFDLIEVGSGSLGFYEGIKELEPFTQRAWRNGWRVMPTIGIDNFGKLNFRYGRKHHLALWQLKQEGRIVLIGTVLEPFTQAIKRRCGYACEDDNLIVKFWVNVNHAETPDREELPMGRGCLPCYEKDPTLFWDIDEWKSAREPWRSLQIVELKKFGDAVYDVLAQGSDEGSLVVKPKPDTICYYLRGTQVDGDSFITSPIWIERRQEIARARAGSLWWGNVTTELYGMKIGERDGLPVLNTATPYATLRWEEWSASENKREYWRLNIVFEYLAGFAEDGSERWGGKSIRFGPDDDRYHPYLFWGRSDCYNVNNIFPVTFHERLVRCRLRVYAQRSFPDDTIELIEIPFWVTRMNSGHKSNDF